MSRLGRNGPGRGVTVADAGRAAWRSLPLVLACLAAGCGKAKTPPLPTAGEPQEGAYSLAFTPDGGTVAVCDWTQHLTLRDLASGKERLDLPMEGDPAQNLAVSPDARLLATVHKDNAVWLRDLGAKEEPVVFKGHRGPVLAVVFSPDGKTLATANGFGQGYNSEYRLWDVAGKKHRRTVGCRWFLGCLAFTPDGKTLAGGTSGQVELWDVETGKERATIPAPDRATQPGDPDENISALAFSPGGNLLALGNTQGTVLVCDVAAAKTVATLRGHKRAVRAVAFAPDGKTLASGGDDLTARLWDLDAQQEKFVLAGHRGAIRAVVFRADGTLATGGGDKAVKVWNTATGQEVEPAK